jgi:hypothetical protein
LKRSETVYGEFERRAVARLRLKAVILCAAGLFVARPDSMVAQVAAPKAKASASGTKAGAQAAGRAAPAAPTVRAPQQRPEDAAAREQILRSQAWQEMMHQFDEWLSAQSLYDPKQIQARLAAGIGRMTAAQLRWFLNDMHEKLEVLTSQAARDASTYLTETLAVASPAYARKIREKLPDVLVMTAAQINQQLSVFAAKHHQTIANQKAFDDSRSQEIADNQAQIAEEQQVLNRDLGKESTAAANASKGNNFTPARDYYPGSVGNDGPFGPGTSYFGGFWGGGFF